jgi:CheY-like chemotaxis protein
MARILVVEDEAPLRRILALNLVRRGHTVIEAESVATAQEALAAFHSQFDLILLDLNLPDQTGWDILRSMKYPSDQPLQRPGGPSRLLAVIVITAGRPARSRLEEFRPAAVLLKPFPIEALLRLIQRVLGAGPAEAVEDDEEQQPFPETASSQESLAVE